MNLTISDFEIWIERFRARDVWHQPFLAARRLRTGAKQIPSNLRYYARPADNLEPEKARSLRTASDTVGTKLRLFYVDATLSGTGTGQPPRDIRVMDEPVDGCDRHAGVAEHIISAREKIQQPSNQARRRRWVDLCVTRSSPSSSCPVASR